VEPNHALIVRVDEERVETVPVLPNRVGADRFDADKVDTEIAEVFNIFPVRVEAVIEDVSKVETVALLAESVE